MLYLYVHADNQFARLLLTPDFQSGVVRLSGSPLPPRKLSEYLTSDGRGAGSEGIARRRIRPDS